MTPLFMKGCTPAGGPERHAQALEEHKLNFDVIAAVNAVDSIDTVVSTDKDHADVTKHTALDLKLPSSMWRTLTDSDKGVDLLIVSGWYDVTVAETLRNFAFCKRKGWHMIVGPWNHAGTQFANMVGTTTISHYGIEARIAKFMKDKLFPQENEPKVDTSSSQHAYENEFKTLLTGRRGSCMNDMGNKTLLTNRQQSIGIDGSKHNIPLPDMPSIQEHNVPHSIEGEDDSDDGSDSDSESDSEMIEDAPVLFFTCGYMQGWATSDVWPPPDVEKWKLDFGFNQTLEWSECNPLRGASFAGTGRSRSPSDTLEYIALPPPPTCPLWTGTSRYVAMLDMVNFISYNYKGRRGDQAEGQALMFTAAAMPKSSTVIVGSPVVAVELEYYHAKSTTRQTENLEMADDVDIFAYLVEETDAGQILYITEGMMRACHRKEATPPEEVKAGDSPVRSKNDSLGLGVEPWHSFCEGDKMSLPKSGRCMVRFAMQPIAWRLAPGSHIGLVIATGDKAHFDPNPAYVPGKDLQLPSIVVGGNSSLWLPISESSRRRMSFEKKI
eukprot:gnl/MRDRNA2_/MRDRNA2_85594_c0_seq2.p1 gnl/MRDRNA2_/MRDRNA2_85594_c0~~gnl/MRDRNA2_/MRDRNA2_85594_c0_seq2.p1  ORF type:complete len:595 (-),score=109.48 gnl/MRDRNA2_/MRDRNA2_85594_c0_seq2:87-1742(-)